MVVQLALPQIDLSDYLTNPTSTASMEACQDIAEALKTYGAVVVQDHRIPETANEEFLNLMEQYFEQDRITKLKDARPELGYQVGVTPDYTESPNCFHRPECLSILHHLDPDNHPLSFHGADPKWRFFHPLKKPLPKDHPPTLFPSLNAAPVIPNNFQDTWLSTLNSFGDSLLQAVTTVTEMLAIGLGLPKSHFTSLCEYGPHLLAPTGSDLKLHGKLNTVLAGFHNDLNFLTIHGQSRFPGLHIWARNTGSKMAVKIPKGSYLVQVGKQLEHLTGGYLLAGYHEVIVTEATLKAIESAQLQSKSLWRISSTLFHHVASDELLAPLSLSNHPVTEEMEKKYPEILCGDFVKKELESLELASSS